MNDPTESLRRDLVKEINAEPGRREKLEQRHGQVWNSQELQRDFEVLGFMAPFVVARRRSDGTRGSLMFQADPRFYIGWAPD
jgi:hypothetical protein